MCRSTSSRSMPNFASCSRTRPLAAIFVLPIRAIPRGIAMFTFVLPPDVTVIRSVRRPRPGGIDGSGGNGGRPGPCALPGPKGASGRTFSSTSPIALSSR